MDSEYLDFLRELPKSFAQIGAMFPSSPLLGRMMVKPLRKRRASGGTGPRRILEVGPGTGPITRQILKHMGAKDSFTICEINERFLTLLIKKLEGNKDYQKHRNRVKFVCCPVQELRRNGVRDRFDIVISSLPFSNFTPETVEEILSLFREITGAKGRLIFFEYLGLRRLSAVFSSRSGKKRIEGVDRVVKEWTEKVSKLGGSVDKSVSLLNVPPALAIEFVYTRQVKAKSGLKARIKASARIRKLVSAAKKRPKKNSPTGKGSSRGQRK